MGFSARFSDNSWYFINQNAAVSGINVEEAKSDVEIILKAIISMAGEIVDQLVDAGNTIVDEIERNVDFDTSILEDIDVEFANSGPIQIVARWQNEDSLDLSGIVFDQNGLFLEAAWIEQKDKMDGLVSLTPEVVSKTESGNDIALTVDWNGLSTTTAGFIGVLLNSREGKSIADAAGCKLTAEQGGVT